MSIDRVPKVPFAQIANSALRDTRLSFKARGVLALVLSNAGEWNASRDFIESMSDHDGRTSVQGALNELTKYGYRIMHKERSDDGKWSSWIEWRHIPTDGFPDGRVSRPSENLTAIKNTIKEKNQEDSNVVSEGLSLSAWPCSSCGEKYIEGRFKEHLPKCKGESL